MRLYNFCSASDVVHARVSEISQYFKNSKKRVIILSTMSPELTNTLSWCDSILLGYSWRCEYSLKAMLGAVNGEFVPEGVKPYN
mgnify:CR=1 FL=1